MNNKDFIFQGIFQAKKHSISSFFIGISVQLFIFNESIWQWFSFFHFQD